jgi:UDP:flavonoid glycosyltransferase YjiC (YdhE family)
VTALKNRPLLLFMPEGNILAHVSRGIEVAKCLRRQNVDIRFACAGAASHLVEEAGFPLIPIATQPRDDLLARLHQGKSVFTHESLKKAVDIDLALLKQLRPDVVVGDFRCSLGISAPLSGVPYICVTNAVWTPYYAGSLEPPDSFILTKILGKRICRLLVPIAQQAVFRHYAAPFNRIRKQAALAVQDDIRRCMSEADLTLLADLPEFAPSMNLPSYMKYVGPIVWEPDIADPEELNTLSADKPVVYLTLGSTGGASLEELARAMSERDWQVICTTGGRSVGQLPESCIAVPFANGVRMCQLADVVVCHGGNGTLYQSLSAGTPVVGLPAFHDQEYNMQQVECLGVGISIPPGRRVLRSLPDAVARVLDDPEARSKANALSRKLKDWNGPMMAADAIREFLAGL